MRDISEVLRGNRYPGRGIIIGKSSEHTGVFAYFIMGRSENSRNRVFEKTKDGIRTRAFDPEKLSDPSLVIYNPLRLYNDAIIVTNGDQTDTIYDFLSQGKDFYDACKSRTYEPDPPIWTPRISGLLQNNGYRLAIVKNIRGEDETPLHCFYDYDKPKAGIGHLIHTYKQDGNPPESFRGEPVEVVIDTKNGIKGFAQKVWESLDNENKVALYAGEINSKGEIQEDIIINKLS